MIDPESGRIDPRLAVVDPILWASRKRAAEMGKLMLEPTDVLVNLLEDPSFSGIVLSVGVDIDRLRIAIDKIESQVSRAKIEKIREVSGFDRTLFTSYVLVQSVQIAERIAETEGEDFVLPQHLLAGMIRQENNTALRSLRDAGATPDQLKVLARMK